MERLRVSTVRTVKLRTTTCPKLTLRTLENLPKVCQPNPVPPWIRLCPVDEEWAGQFHALAVFYWVHPALHLDAPRIPAFALEGIDDRGRGVLLAVCAQRIELFAANIRDAAS